MCGLTFHDIVMSRYATKKFDGKKIPEELVTELFDIIRYAPSGLNVQPWKVKVITDQKLKAKLAPVSRNQPQITSCSHLLVFCADTDFAGHAAKMEQVMRKGKVPEENITEYAATMREFIKQFPKERVRPWAQQNLFLALANALQGAKALGFDSCPMGGFDADAYAKILDLPPTLVPTMLCPLGYAADTPKPKFRLPRDEVFF